MATEYLETFLRYVFSVGKNLDDDNFEQVKHRIETNYPEGSGTIMTWAEIFMERGMEKGMKKGLQEGLEQGEQKQAVKTVIKLLTKKFGILQSEMQEKIQALDITVLEIIIEELFQSQFQSLDDVQKYLK